MSIFTLPKQPAKFRIVGLPSGWDGESVYDAPPQERQAERDEFGLATAIYGHAPRLGRQYAALCLETLGMPKTVSPTQLFGVSAGTIPELVTFGFLISEGFRYRSSGPRSFVWLSYETAGNVEAQTQLDFSVYVAAMRRIGVDVDSIFHTAKNPYHPGAKLEQDRRRRQRLLTQGGLHNVISVNRGPQHVLEYGPQELVYPELVRVLYA